MVCCFGEKKKPWKVYETFQGFRTGTRHQQVWINPNRQINFVRRCRVSFFCDRFALLAKRAIFVLRFFSSVMVCAKNKLIIVFLLLSKPLQCRGFEV
jgi:hypothetical protein